MKLFFQLLLFAAEAFLITCDANAIDECKRAIVAGGAGFVGSHLCDRLLDEGYEVICVDNLQTGSLDNICHLHGCRSFRFVEANITELCYEGEKIDEIYNLACPASPKKYQASPIETLKTNFNGTHNLLQLAEDHNAKFFQASTSEVYGNPSVHPQPESYWGHVNPMGIRSCYDEGKRVAETLCFEFNRTLGTAVKVARIFNTYGPRMAPDDGRVVSNFIVQSLQGKKLTIYGDGTQTRSFCYVADLVDGIRTLMNTEGTFTGPVNLGNPHEITILELASTISLLTDNSSEIVFHKLPSDDPIRRNPDITLAKTKLSWEPKVSLHEGLTHTIHYFKTIQNN